MGGLSLDLGLSIGGGLGAWSPSKLSGLTGWLRADLGVTVATGVSQWADQSGNSNTFVQATGAAQPTLNANDSNFNGKPSVTFNGSSQFLTLSSISMGGTPSVLFVWTVVRLLAAGSFPEIFTYQSTNYEFRGNSATGDPSFVANGATPASWGSSTVGATRAIYVYDLGTGTKSAINVSNGVEVTATPVSHTIPNAVQCSIGARPGGTLFANMSMSELVICNSMPSAGDLANLQSYAQRYGSV